MPNPRVSLTSVGATEVRHGNTQPTTRTARFFSYTHFGKLNWPRKVHRNGGCDRCSRSLVVLVTVLIGQRLQLLEPNSQAISDFFWRYSNVRYAFNKRRASPGRCSQELSSHTKVNEIRQRRLKWRQFKKVAWSVLLDCTIAWGWLFAIMITNSTCVGVGMCVCVCMCVHFPEILAWLLLDRSLYARVPIWQHSQ